MTGGRSAGGRGLAVDVLQWRTSDVDGSATPSPASIVAITIMAKAQQDTQVGRAKKPIKMKSQDGGHGYARDGPCGIHLCHTPARWGMGTNADVGALKDVGTRTRKETSSF